MVSGGNGNWVSFVCERACSYGSERDKTSVVRDYLKAIE